MYWWNTPCGTCEVSPRKVWGGLKSHSLQTVVDIDSRFERCHGHLGQLLSLKTLASYICMSNSLRVSWLPNDGISPIMALQGVGRLACDDSKFELEYRQTKTLKCRCSTDLRCTIFRKAGGC